MWIKWCGVAGSEVWVCPDPDDEREEPGVGHDQAAHVAVVLTLDVLPADRQHVLTLLHVID